MARLVPTKLRVRLDKGLQLRVSDKDVPIGSLVVAENVEVRRTSLAKRNGFTPFQTAVAGTTGSVPRGQSVSALGKSLVVLASGSSYAYGDEQSAWSNRGYVSRVTAVDHTSVFQAPTDMLAVSSADFGNGYRLYGWTTVTPGGAGIVHAAVVGVTSSVRYQSDYVLGEGYVPRAVAFAGSGFLYWWNGASRIAYAQFSPADPTAQSGVTFLNFDVGHRQGNAARPFDVVASPDGTMGWLAYVSGTTGNQDVRGRLVPLSPFGLIDTFPGTAALSASMAVAGGDFFQVAVDAGLGGKVVVAMAEQTGSIPIQTVVHSWGFLTDAGVSPLWSDKRVLDTNWFDTWPAAVGKLSHLAVNVRADGRTDVLVGQGGFRDTRWHARERIGAVPYTAWAVLDATGSITNGTPTVPHRLPLNVTPVTRPWTHDGETYVGVVTDELVEDTYFVLRDDGQVAARFLWGKAGDAPASGVLTEVTRTGPASYAFPVTEKGRLQAVGTVSGSERFTVKGLARVDVEFDGRREPVLSDGVLLRGGGILGAYDDNSWVEESFHRRGPEILLATLTDGATSGGKVVSGSYSYVTVLEWTDDRQRLHRSAPSVPYAVDAHVPTGGDEFTVRLDISPYGTTALKGTRAEPLVGFYRTVKDDSSAKPVFYRVNPTGSILEVGANGTASFVDWISDAALVGNEVIYTTGGVLESQPPPAARVVRVGKNRVWLAGLEDDPLGVAFSKSLQQGIAAEFNDALRLRVDPLGGRITDLFVMDDWVVVFKRGAIFAFAGDGPDDLGQGQHEFSAPYLVSSDVGCANPDATVLTSQGVMFQGDKGIWLLGRDRQVSYVGAPVEGLVGLTATTPLTIVSAESMQDANQVRFLCREGVSLVFDTLTGDWTTATVGGESAALRGDTDYVYLSGSGVVMQQQSGSYYADAGGAYGQTIETGWLKVGEAFSEVERVLFIEGVASYKGPHLMQVEQMFDYDPTVRRTTTFDPNDLGVTGTGSLYEFRLYPWKKRNQSMKLRFRDLASGSLPLYDSFVMEELNFHVLSGEPHAPVRPAGKRG